MKLTVIALAALCILHSQHLALCEEHFSSPERPGPPRYVPKFSRFTPFLTPQSLPGPQFGRPSQPRPHQQPTPFNEHAQHSAEFKSSSEHQKETTTADRFREEFTQQSTTLAPSFPRPPVEPFGNGFGHQQSGQFAFGSGRAGLLVDKKEPLIGMDEKKKTKEEGTLMRNSSSSTMTSDKRREEDDGKNNGHNLTEEGEDDERKEETGKNSSSSSSPRQLLSNSSSSEQQPISFSEADEKKVAARAEGAGPYAGRNATALLSKLFLQPNVPYSPELVARLPTSQVEKPVTMSSAEEWPVRRGGGDNDGRGREDGGVSPPGREEQSQGKFEGGRRTGNHDSEVRSNTVPFSSWNGPQIGGRGANGRESEREIGRGGGDRADEGHREPSRFSGRSEENVEEQKSKGREEARSGGRGGEGRDSSGGRIGSEEKEEARRQFTNGGGRRGEDSPRDVGLFGREGSGRRPVEWEEWKGRPFPRGRGESRGGGAEGRSEERNGRPRMPAGRSQEGRSAEHSHSEEQRHFHSRPEPPPSPPQARRPPSSISASAESSGQRTNHGRGQWPQHQQESGSSRSAEVEERPPPPDNDGRDAAGREFPNPPFRPPGGLPTPGHFLPPHLRTAFPAFPQPFAFERPNKQQEKQQRLKRRVVVDGEVRVHGRQQQQEEGRK